MNGSKTAAENFLTSEIMRMGNQPTLDRFTDWSDAFVLHDKRLPGYESLTLEDLPLGR